jgi:hypothetical protein
MLQVLLSESKTGHDTEIYWSMSQQTHYDVTDKNSYVDFVGLNIHYHLYRILKIMSIATISVSWPVFDSDNSTQCYQRKNVQIADKHP